MFEFDINKVISEKEVMSYQQKVSEIDKNIKNKTGLGSDMLGWVDYPRDYDKAELERMVSDARKVRENFDVLVVCGIGGSYLGTRCAYEAMKGFKNDDEIEIIFMGHTFSPNYNAQVLEYLKDKNFAINVISKSGTTLETSVIFRILKKLLIDKVGKEKAKEAIFAITDKSKGALRKLCDKEGYTSYTLQSDIGGRYSVLTSVGCFPLAVAGIDVKKLIEGANQARIDFDNDDLKTNGCYRYAVARNYLYEHGFYLEMFVTFEPQMKALNYWCKQLFAESEGKQGKGIYPTGGIFSTDLHSTGQILQEGPHVFFETIVRILNPNQDVIVPEEEDNFDGLNFLSGKKLSYITEQSFRGTLQAHQGVSNIPCNIITVDKMNEFNLGYIFYFFMKACAMSAYLLGLNPFDQPGVDVYKKNVAHFLGND